MPGRDLLKLYAMYGLIVVGVALACIPALHWLGFILLALAVLAGAYRIGRDRRDH